MATNSELFWPFPPSQIGTPIGGYPGHQGTDWPKPTGTPAPATSNGTIVFAGDDGLGGQTIDLQRDDGLIQRFGHLSAIWVRVGQRVNAGNTIGLVCSTGNSTGPHLHWELRWDRLWNGGRVVDPSMMNPSVFGNPEPKPPVKPKPLEEDEMQSLIVDGVHLFAVASEFISHHGTKSQAAITRNVMSATDELHKLNNGQFMDLLDGLGIPRSVVKGGAVLNPQSGVIEANGTWSRNREILATLSKK